MSAIIDCICDTKFWKNKLPCRKTEKRCFENYSLLKMVTLRQINFLWHKSFKTQIPRNVFFNIKRLRLTIMRANSGFLNGRTLGNRINMKAWVLNSCIGLLYRTQLVPTITSRKTVSPSKTMVTDFDILLRDYLIVNVRPDIELRDITTWLTANKSWLSFTELMWCRVLS